jgi:hypothetical protein
MTPARLDHQDDQRLNAAITAASMKDSFESYLYIVDAFYSEDVELIEARFRAASGLGRTFSWSVERRWKEGGVNYERHYDHHVVGPPSL